LFILLSYIILYYTYTISYIKHGIIKIKKQTAGMSSAHQNIKKFISTYIYKLTITEILLPLKMFINAIHYLQSKRLIFIYLSEDLKSLVYEIQINKRRFAISSNNYDTYY